jgi:hypothetical protein
MDRRGQAKLNGLQGFIPHLKDLGNIIAPHYTRRR